MLQKKRAFDVTERTMENRDQASIVIILNTYVCIYLPIIYRQ